MGYLSVITRLVGLSQTGYGFGEEIRKTKQLLLCLRKRVKDEFRQ